MFPYILHLRIQFFKGSQHLSRYFPSQLYISVLCHDDSDYKVLDMRQVDEVLVIVEVHHVELRVGLGLTNKTGTFCMLLLVWFKALISNVVVWINF